MAAIGNGNPVNPPVQMDGVQGPNNPKIRRLPAPRGAEQRQLWERAEDAANYVLPLNHEPNQDYKRRRIQI